MVLDEEIRRKQSEIRANKMIEKIKAKVTDKGFRGWKRKPSGSLGLVRFEKKINGKTLRLHFGRRTNVIGLDIEKGIFSIPRTIIEKEFEDRFELAKTINNLIKNEKKIKKLAKLKGLL